MITHSPQCPFDKPEPIKVTARRIDRAPETAIRLAKRGRLRAWQDASGRWLSTKRAADEFLGLSPEHSVAVDIAEMREALK